MSAADARAALSGVAPSPRTRMERRDADGMLLERPAGPPPGVVAIEAAVLVPIYSAGDELVLVFTLRSDGLRQHAGQMAFPGGRVDEEDETPLAAAEREAREELGTALGTWHAWGPLPSVYIAPTNFRMHPFVAYAPTRPVMHASEHEIAEVVEIPLSSLTGPDVFAYETRPYAGRIVQEPVFRHGPYRIWGATALVVDELLARLEAGR
ncbi:MAG: CoA pyrophosphatase [Deltaproteobacteria bacterium]|nr:CoA pyrophosphatase [Deltaproteobacteria bacterium]